MDVCEHTCGKLAHECRRGRERGPGGSRHTTLSSHSTLALATRRRGPPHGPRDPVVNRYLEQVRGGPYNRLH